MNVNLVWNEQTKAIVEYSIKDKQFHQLLLCFWTKKLLKKLHNYLKCDKFKALFTRHKLTQVVFTRHFSKLTRVEPGLVRNLFSRQTSPGRTRVSSVYTTETNLG